MSIYPQELKDEIIRMKVEAFDQIWSCRDIPPEHTGHSSKADRALRTIEHAKKQIEKKLLKWEKENP